MRSGQENVFPIENDKQALSQAQNITDKQVFIDNGAFISMSQGISQQGIPEAELKAFNQHNKTRKQKSDQTTVTDTISKKPKLNSTELFQSQKKLKLPRCSKCLKKIDYSVLFKCNCCEKTYHTTCTQVNDVCFRCLEKEKKKKIKKEMKLQEKLVKQNYAPMKRDDIEIDSDMDEDVKSKMMFLKNFPFYSKGYEIQYPVEDSLFDLYPNVLTPQVKGTRPKCQYLPSYYGSLMQIWNIMITFPHFFGIDSNFSIQQLMTKITAPQMDKKFQQSLLKLLYFHLRDSTWDNLEQYRENKYFPFLSLLRFCTESGFLDRLFAYTWPKFLACCFDMNLIQIPVEFQYLQAKILEMDLQGSYKLFESIQQRIDFFTMMARALCETTSFRAMLNDKSDFEKVSSKQKNSWIEGKKTQQAQLANIKDRLKTLAKEKKKISKLVKKRQLVNGEQLLQRIQLQEYKLNEERQTILERIKEIDVEIDTVNFTFTGFSNIALVGHDKSRNNYWFISDQTDRIIVENGQQWGYYPLSSIKPLMNSLNIRGIRENHLYHSLQQYQNLLQSNSYSMIVQDKEQSVSPLPSQNENGSIYGQIEEINMSTIIKLILQSQKKMTKYLLERNARWQNQTERKSFIDKVSNQMKEVSEYLQELRFFNQRICVVEIQYKIILEDSAEQIDSRTRKIQTKIWGINEKYKHSWYDYAKMCQSMTDLFFLVSVLFLNVQKYVSKNRKLRKQYEEVKGPIIYLKTKTGELLQQKWDQNCDNCGGTGQLLCCDICPKVYHLECIGLTEIPYQEFKCKICIKKRHTRTQLRKNICEQ